MATPILRLNPAEDSEVVGLYMELYRGEAKDAGTISQTSDADWSPSTKMVPSFGMDDTGQRSYWVRFRIENPTPLATVIYLANHYPTTDHLRLYEEGPDQRLTLLEEQGDQAAYSRRSVRHRFPVFRVSLTPGVHTFYLEQQSFASIQYPLKLWQPDAFTSFATHENLMLGGIIGMCLFALIYNFFIFLRLKVDVYFLYMLHNASICIFLANFLGFTQSTILPHADQSWWLNTGAKVNMDIVHITAISFTLVFLDLKKNAPRWRHYFLGLMGIAILTLLNTLTIKWRFNTQTVLFSMITSLSLLVTSVSLWKKFAYARYYTIGWTFMLLLNMGTMLALLGVLPTDITLISWSQSLGHCFELCLLSLALGERMAWINRMREETLLELTRTKSNLVAAEQERGRIQARLLNEREQHIRDLDRKVADRTRDLQSILNNLQQGIFALRWEHDRCLMDADYSPYLHTILGRFDTKDEDPLELLFQRSGLGHDDKSRIRSILISMMDGDRIGFDLNSASLPREIERTIDAGRHQILEIDWDPIVDAKGSIEKILVAVRDVTEYRDLRKKLVNQSEDLTIARDLLQDGNSASVSSVARIAADLDELVQHTPQDINHLLRRLHSLKGDSRTLLLKTLSEHIHNLETIWIQDRAATDQCLKALRNTARLARRYHEIIQVLERRFQPAASAKHGEPEPSIPLRKLLPLDQVPVLARELGKLPPMVNCDDFSLVLSADAMQGLQECFGHLVRNALDHGLETPDERRRAGKPEQGQLTITVREDRKGWTITIEDDGRGLNLARIREKTRALNPEETDDQTIAQCIFQAEFTTRDELSIISGRGIGLDAVHHRLHSLGGTIEVELLPGLAAPGYRRFALHIRLPRRATWDRSA